MKKALLCVSLFVFAFVITFGITTMITAKKAEAVWCEIISTHSFWTNEGCITAGGQAGLEYWECIGYTYVPGTGEWVDCGCSISCRVWHEK